MAVQAIDDATSIAGLSGLVGDEDLIQRWLSGGDRVALDTLLQRYLGPIRRFVAEMLLDESNVDDVTQDVFLRAIRGLPTFEQRSKFSTWLFQVARNAVYNQLERDPRRRCPTRSNLAEEWNGRHDRPEDMLLSAEAVHRVEAALAELTPKLRTAMVLVCLHGRSAEEVAAIEGCAVGTIYSRLHEARKQLKERLGDLT